MALIGMAAVMGGLSSAPQPNTPTTLPVVVAERKDSTIVPFKVRPTVAITDTTARKSGDLRDPSNLKTGLTYDPATQHYNYGTRLGETYLHTPFLLSEDEVRRLAIQESMRQYFRRKNREEQATQGKNQFDFSNIQFSLGPAERIFGPGGVQLKTNGNAEIKLGTNYRFTDNPSLSEMNRSVFGFDFNEKINLSLNGKVGDKVNMDFNYNSEATFNFDTQNFKLRYEGKEDEIIKLIEAGNVSMPANSSLIRGSSSLFGLRTDLQFGKLRLQSMLAQKKSASQSVSSQGGVQLSNFEFSADSYDENRHFFLAHFFRNHYDQWMSQLPNVLSGLTINRIEVWVTNKNGTTTNTRNIVALTDLGEQQKINTQLWQRGNEATPSNAANNAYASIVAGLDSTRNIGQLNQQLESLGLGGSEDYEKLENARLLSPSEYRLNVNLGYISLRSALQNDQVLAVAFEYNYRGRNYQVGEFSTDFKDNKQTLLVKSLRNTANHPAMKNWHLMMRNVYALGASAVQKENFRLDVKYRSDSAGVYLNYLPENGFKDQKLIALLGVDRLDNNNKPRPNGYFDFVEGYTIDANSGRVYFPVVEPFGEHLAQQLGSAALAARYAYTELYDSTHIISQQISEHNKFLITGQYRATKNDEISLGVINIPQGSVVVTAGGVLLTEGTDYTVDYYAGTVRIINKSILDAGTPISCSVESNTDYGMQRKTMFGLNFQYDFSKSLQFGGTFMHLNEQALTNKVAMGTEPLNNTIWGLNLSWKKESQWLTNLFDRLPLLSLSAPSRIQFNAEVAQLITGKSSGGQADASYVDDFENTKSAINLGDPQAWILSSTPSMFAESRLSNDLRYGYNRALLAWYVIDPLFTRRGSALTPAHLKNDLAQLSDPRIKEVYISDLYPNKSINYKEAATLPVLNLAFYPTERGPYNFDPALDRNGKLLQPKQRWGGMMRRLDITNFEDANVDYVEFWLMDPYTPIQGQHPTYQGDLYINLGEVSEDILKDGKKFYESGMPIDGNLSQVEETVWGRVPSQNSVTYAFNTSTGSRRRQDVGYNGLTSEEERSFAPYQPYLNAIRSIVRPEVYDSILQSPSADKYHFYRGSDYDQQRRSILERYKYINNPNGNAVAAEDNPEAYSTAYKTTPEVEDPNQDYTLNEYEKYYQYRIRISPADLQVGRNHIVDVRTVSSTARDGSKTETKYYLFRVPVGEYESKVGNIQDFTSVRFMRMFMTGFDQPVVLRFATLNLVRGEWNAYEQSLTPMGASSNAATAVAVSAVNFEENNEKTPVNYVLPPGVSRSIEPGQEQVLQNNEQSLAMTVKHLDSGDARAVYKQVQLDLRRYKHLQLFAHANSLPDEAPVADGEVSLFLRLGTDHKNNFYEYEIPLVITPEGNYLGTTGQHAVWPAANMVDIDLSIFSQLKKNRNRQKSLGISSIASLYSEYDPRKPKNKISIQGNPTLGEVRTMMIGVRNNSRSSKSVEVWANELRLQEFSNSGGWAAQSQLNVQLSDLATINLNGHLETSGFGGLEQSVSQRRDNDLYQYSVATNIDLGRLLPEKVKLNAPVYYAYGKDKIVPRYNPLDTDMSVSESLEGLHTTTERDSLSHIVNRVVTNKNFSISGLRFNRRTKGTAMPYDLGNFTFSYGYAQRYTTGATIRWENDMNWRFNLDYAYSPTLRAWEPFRNRLAKSSPWLRIVRDFGLYYLPQNVSFHSEIARNYYEFQERDMQQLDNTHLPISFASDFLWNRNLQLRWDPTKLIHFNFKATTRAEIEQPHVVVNKDLYPTEYAHWKDSVWHSVRSWGRPLNYQQTADVSWYIPLNKLPIFEWVTSDVKYSSNYTWQRGADLLDGASLGNTITTQRTINANARLNLEALYNYVPFLKKVNRKFSASSGTLPKREQKKFEKEYQLRTDTTVIVPHSLRSKALRVTALRPDGSRYPLRYKILDGNRLEIQSRDSAKLKINITPRKATDEQSWYKFAEYGARGLMMLRNVNISYTNSYALNLSDFRPMIGDFFGQSAGMTPGLAFAFGAVGDDYVSQAAQRNWLMQSDSLVTPAMTTASEDLQIRATLEPVRNMRINLNMARNWSRSKSIFHMYQGYPSTQSGSFTMTTLSLGSAFSSAGDARSNYASRSFARFLSLLDGYRDRLQARYANSNYPANMPTYGGTTYNTAHGEVDKYSAEVMIPAFLSAYGSGGNSLEIFPSITRILPNWTMAYSGLSQLKGVKKWLKNLNINHGYRSLYSVGSYASYQSYVENYVGLGFIQNVHTGAPQPSSMYDISTVALNESFTPLLGIDATFHNNMTAKLEYRKTRVLTLSMTSQQIIEARSNDLVIGMGYRVANFSFFPQRNAVKKRLRSSTRDSDVKRPRNDTQKQFDHSLNLRLDLAFRDQSSLQRNILTQSSQATSGNKAIQLSVVADYALSKYVTIACYFERQSNTPLLSAGAYPTTTQDFGINLKLSLSR